MIKYIITILVGIVFISLFKSCRDDSSKIERYRNEYRDPNIIGEWKSIVSGDINIFTESGRWKGYTTLATGEKDSLASFYYYTKGDKLYYMFPKDKFKGGGSSNLYIYKLKNDTLTLYYPNSLKIGYTFKKMKR